EVVEKLRPPDAVRRVEWLFQAHLPDVGDERADYQSQVEKVAEVRGEAVRDLLQEGGIDALLRLARDVDWPGAVGATAVDVDPPDLEAQVLPMLSDENPKHANFAFGYVSKRARTAGEEWVEAGLKVLTGDPVAQA